ncbi:MAG: HTH domain-containing protein [Lachnospiraceae bacterium]|nr:HTH domain-containing protein [Lachnospiraceae bacterium]
MKEDQEHGSGRFVENPEYPEFPWFEGIINAIAHRDYAASGQFIKVSMFDDRLEIESPGRFPNIVTADNISYTRFSRNKTISRVMTEFEWVRELNEGVKKIYSDMTDAGLPEPEYIETPNTVRLVLRNNIDVRKNKTSHEISGDGSNKNVIENVIENDKLEQYVRGCSRKKAERTRIIIDVIKSNPSITISELKDKIQVTDRTIARYLKDMRDAEIIQREGSDNGGRWIVL